VDTERLCAHPLIDQLHDGASEAKWFAWCGHSLAIRGPVRADYANGLPHHHHRHHPLLLRSLRFLLYFISGNKQQQQET